MPISTATTLDAPETRAALQEVIERARRAFTVAAQLDRAALIDPWTSPHNLPDARRPAAEIFLRVDSASPNTGEASHWAVLVVCSMRNVVTVRPATQVV